MEVAIASEATKVAVLGNMHMDARVIEVACIKSEIKFNLKVTEAVWRLLRPQRPPK